MLGLGEGNAGPTDGFEPSLEFWGSFVSLWCESTFETIAQRKSMKAAVANVAKQAARAQGKQTTLILY